VTYVTCFSTICFSTIWNYRNITVDVKVKLLCFLSSITCCWYMDFKERWQKRLLAFEMRYYWNLLNMRRQQKVINDSIRQKVNRKENIIDIIRRKKLVLFGHVCCMLNHRLVKKGSSWMLFGEEEDNQSERRIDNITEWTGLSAGDAMKTEDREQWRKFVFGLNGLWPWDKKREGVCHQTRHNATGILVCLSYSLCQNR